MAMHAFPKLEVLSLNVKNVLRASILELQFEKAEIILRQYKELGGNAETGSHFEQAIEFNKTSDLIPARKEVTASTESGTGVWSTAWAASGVLLIKGQTIPSCRRVFIFINDRVIKVLNTAEDENHGERKFYFYLKDSLLKALPKKARLSVGSETGPLLHTKGKLHYSSKKLSGDDSLFAKLKAGRFVTKKGRLRLTNNQNKKWQDDILTAYTKFCGYFEATFGYKAFIIYGTLLGYYRDNAFISHDDDMDVAYCSRHSAPEDIKQELMSIMQRLLSDGFSVYLSYRRGFFRPKVGKMRFDVFPMWFDDNKLWMQNTTCLDIGKDAIEPIQRKDFLGVQVYVPNKPEEFIAAKYGPNWKTPDPGYRPVAK
ncbi:MAG TPA: hypothetical protein VGL10_01060, partial [Gammaproteobacteria bacterium]